MMTSVTAPAQQTLTSVSSRIVHYNAAIVGRAAAVGEEEFTDTGNRAGLYRTG
jgi:hypothetical protein